MNRVYLWAIDKIVDSSFSLGNLTPGFKFFIKLVGDPPKISELIGALEGFYSLRNFPINYHSKIL